MAEYELSIDSHEAQARFDALDEFVRDYVIAMFWTDCSSDSEDMADASFDELDEKTLADIASECDDFQVANARDISKYQEKTGHTGGVDFWLTRNRHGAGFWDRGLGALGDRLSEAAKVYGSVNLYRGDDGKIYVS